MENTDENVFSPLFLLFTHLILYVSVECFAINKLYSQVQSVFRSILINNASHDNTARQVLPHFKEEETRTPLILYSLETAEHQLGSLLMIAEGFRIFQDLKQIPMISRWLWLKISIADPSAERFLTPSLPA